MHDLQSPEPAARTGQLDRWRHGMATRNAHVDGARSAARCCGIAETEQEAELLGVDQIDGHVSFPLVGCELQQH